MSSALNTAIYQRLTGLEVLTERFLAAQQLLAATLAQDPDTDLAAVYLGNVNDSPIVVDADHVRMPVITFRPTGGMPDPRFAHGLAVDNGYYDFEIWSWQRTANAITDLAEALLLLIDRRFGAPALPLAAGAVAWCEPFVSLSQLYDEQRNGWIGLIRVRFIELRE